MGWPLPIVADLLVEKLADAARVRRCARLACGRALDALAVAIGSDSQPHVQPRRAVEGGPVHSRSIGSST